MENNYLLKAMWDLKSDPGSEKGHNQEDLKHSNNIM